MSGLSPKQQMATQLKAMGKSNTFIANELGVSNKQVGTWTTLPVFKAEVSRLLANSEEEACYQLKSLVSTALATIAELLADKTASDNVRMGGAIKVLELVMLKGAAPMPSGGDMPTNSAKISMATIKTIRETIYGIYSDEDLEPGTEMQRRLPGS